VLLSVALSLALLPIEFTGVLLLYYSLTLGYSFYFKRVEVMDVICLAILYTVRVVAGGVVGGLALSNWFVGFVLFLFLCLAFIKRHSELYYLRQSNKHQASGRGYVADDLEILASMGVASGYLAVLVLTFYINSPEVRELYSQPDLLWLVSVLMLYWISRVWLIAHRGHTHDDPVVFALKDKTSYVVIALVAIVVGIAL
jgi:4-hydroxybenzoate polyprenyltransferase